MYLSYLLTKPNDSDCVITVMARYTEKGIWINHIHIKKKKGKKGFSVAIIWYCGGESFVFLYGEKNSVALGPSMDLPLNQHVGKNVQSFRASALS